MTTPLAQEFRTPLVDTRTGQVTAPWQKRFAQFSGGANGTAGAGMVVPFSATPTFDASVASAFDITLTGNVTSSTVINTSVGQIVTFVIVQDATGGRTFAWPTNIKNATAPNTDANSVTVQSFVCRSGGNLYPIGPATYS